MARRLAAIMFTDLSGFTQLAQADEAAALRLLKEQERLIQPILKGRHGRVVKSMGDGLLIEFPDALDAVNCGVELQHRVHERNAQRKTRPLEIRVGIHLGDVQRQGTDILGDAVNIASRVEPLAEPEGVCLSFPVYDQVRNKVPYHFESLGQRTLKGVHDTVEIYRVVFPWTRKAITPAIPLLPRLAVLPLVNLSPDAEDEYFADGLTEELISVVSRIGGLRVIARTSVSQYRKTTKTIAQIGSELGVSSVLEGSVRKAGDQLRVTVQLIDVRSQEPRWAQNYDRKLENVFAIQSEVAQQIADTLRVTIPQEENERIERRPTESTTAFTLYLKGRSLLRAGGAGNIQKALECFGQAVKEDPGFALGHLGQADCYTLLGTWFFDMEGNLGRAKEALATALELDPGLAEAHATQGTILACDGDLRRAEEDYRAAIRLKPNYARAHAHYASLLISQSRWEEALEQIRKVVELDPLSIGTNMAQGDFYGAKRDYIRALEQYRRIVALDPTHATSHMRMFFIYGWMGRFEEMQREATTLVELLRDLYPLVRTWAEANIALFEGDVPTLRRLMAEMGAAIEARPQEPGPVCIFLAFAHFHLHENDQGFHWLDRACARREVLDNLLASAEEWDGVRSDPRYFRLLKRLGLE